MRKHRRRAPPEALSFRMPDGIDLRQGQQLRDRRAVLPPTRTKYRLSARFDCLRSKLEEEPGYHDGFECHNRWPNTFGAL